MSFFELEFSVPELLIENTSHIVSGHDHNSELLRPIVFSLILKDPPHVNLLCCLLEERRTEENRLDLTDSILLELPIDCKNLFIKIEHLKFISKGFFGQTNQETV